MSARSTELAERVAIITGAAGAIGGAAADLLQARGAIIVAVDLPGTDWAALDRPDWITIDADVTREDDVRGYVRTVVDRFGRIDIFFNNAGVEGPVAPVQDYDLAAFRRVQAVNVDGCFLGLKHVLPVMYRQGSGSVINTSSTAGLRGGAGMIGYSASKHAVVGLTKVAACEAAPHGVRVNAVNPGPIDGRMITAIEDGMGGGAGIHAAIEASVPARRYGRPHEVAEVVAFLASDAAAYCQGGCYTVDGGYTAS